MNKKTDSVFKQHHRGRPVNNLARDISQQIVDAAELLLQQHDHYELTNKIIATEAGVDEAMIRYYFSDRNGLMLTIINRYTDQISEALEAFETINIESKTITHDIIKILIDAYYEKPWILRVLTTELTRRCSPIKNAYLKRTGHKGRTLEQLQKTIERFIENGVYVHQVNITFVTLGIISLVTTPIILASFYDGEIKLENLKKNDWVDYIANLFDHHLRPNIGESNE